MSQLEMQQSETLKLAILMSWLKANGPIAFTANIKWLDWIITHYKQDEKLNVIDAMDKLSNFEDELISKLSDKNEKSKKGNVNKRTSAAFRKLTNIPIFFRGGPAKYNQISILGKVVDETTGITITLGDIKQILNNITHSTLSIRDIIDSYDKAGKWIEKISPDVCCYYKYPEGTPPIGSPGAVAVANALSLLVEPYSYEFGYTIKDESKVEALYNKLLGFKKDDKFGAGFLPGDDVERCDLPIVESTAIASIALCNYYYYLIIEDKIEKRNDVKKVIEPVVEWLKAHQFEDGYWSTYKSDDYRPYPSIQATQLALVALSIAPSMNSETKKCIRTSISYIQKEMINDGWGIDFRKEYDLIATARMVWALMAVPPKLPSLKKNELNNVIEIAMHRFNSKIWDYKEQYHIEKINIPNQNGTRSKTSADWYIPSKPFIMSTILRYYSIFKDGNIDEDLEKYIQNGLLEITSKQHQELGCWTGTYDGINDNFSPSATYYYASTLFQKAIVDYTYLRSTLKVKEEEIKVNE